MIERVIFVAWVVALTALFAVLAYVCVMLWLTAPVVVALAVSVLLVAVGVFAGGIAWETRP
jgi:hypothetical protein